MSLIEVLIATVILGGVLVSMATLTARFVRVVTDTGARSRALQIAADRLEAVKAAPTYAGIDTLFSEALPVAVPGFAGFRRQTLVQRVGGRPTDRDDYRVVTVVVTAPTLPAPVRRTTIISDF